MRDGDGDGVVCEAGSRSVSHASSPSSPWVWGTGTDRTATARRCGAVTPTASRVATVRINGGSTATTTAGPTNGRRCSSPDTATRKAAVGEDWGPAQVSCRTPRSQRRQRVPASSRTSPRIDCEGRRCKRQRPRQGAQGSWPELERVPRRRSLPDGQQRRRRADRSGTDRPGEGDRLRRSARRATRRLVVRHVTIFGHGHGLQRAIIDESQHRKPERLMMAQH